MNEVFDLLATNKLTDDEHIESTIMNQWSVKHIIDFKDRLLELIESISPITKQSIDLGDYSFVANSDMSAQHNATCPAWGCRLRRVDDLARFSALYSDRVYIQNYFFDYEHSPTNRYEEYDLRQNFAGDLKILIKLKPLLVAGIIQFVQPTEPEFHLCHKCVQELVPTFKEINSALEKRVITLSKEYLRQTSAMLYIDKYLADIPVYNIEVKSSDQLWENGIVVIVSEELSPTLKKKSRITPRDTLINGIELSKNEIWKADIIQGSLHIIARDIWTQYLMSQAAGLNVKYLTNRDIDVSFLEAITRDKHYKKYNETLKRHLIYELPIFQDIPLASVLDIRQKEYDAFLMYRDGINKVVREYISQHKDLHSFEAKEIYEDIIQPKLRELNRRVQSIKRSLWEKPAKTVAITAGILTIGLYSGIITPEAGPIVATAGGIPAVKSIIESIIEASRTPREIRNDNFYFLWKLSRRQ